MNKKFTLLLSFLWVLLFSNSVFADRYIKVAGIDFAAVFKRYSATAKVRAKLESIRKEVAQIIAKERRNISELENRFRKNINTRSEMEQRWQRSEIELLKAKLADKIQYYNSRLLSIENKMTLPFVTEIYLAAKKIAEGYGYSIVMHHNRFVKLDLQYDITNAVLLYLERKLRGEVRE